MERKVQFKRYPLISNLWDIYYWYIQLFYISFRSWNTVVYLILYVNDHTYDATLHNDLLKNVNIWMIQIYNTQYDKYITPWGTYCTFTCKCQFQVISINIPKDNCAFTTRHYAAWRHKYDNLHIKQTSISQEGSKIWKSCKRQSLTFQDLFEMRGFLLDWTLCCILQKSLCKNHFAKMCRSSQRHEKKEKSIR